MIITLLLFCAVAIVLLHYYVHHSRTGQLINRIPGMRVFPFVGNLPQLTFCSQEERWNLLHTITKQYYPITKIWSFTVCCVLICHPDDMETILSSTKHIQKGFVYNLLHPWLNTGLLTSTGEKWQKRRKILTPAFHFNILKQLVNVLIDESDRMVKSLNDNEETIIADLVSFISQHMLNAICETAMGISLRNMSAFEQQYRQAIHEMGDHLTYRIFRPWLYNDLLFALTPTGRKQAKNLKILHGFTERIIAERKDYHKRTNGKYLKDIENNTITDTDDVDIMKRQKRRLAMLDLLIANSANGNFSDLDIREEVDTFMFGGHDTVAMSICFTLLLLAEHKQIQDRVREEVCTVMKESGEKFTITALQNLPYLDRCLKESLRLYPSIPLIYRTCAEDVKLHSYVVPSKTMLLFNICDLHRDPNFWPNPNVFDPDRFSPEKIKNRHPYSYIPFSAGPRNCIGQRFAMLELKAIIAQLVHDFHLVPVGCLKDFSLKPDIVTRIAHPVGIKFIQIKRA